MRRRRKLPAAFLHARSAALFLLISSLALPAAASDMRGIVSLFFGIPGMAATALLFAVLAHYPRRHPALYAVSAVIAFVALLPFGLVMASDAIDLGRRGNPGYAATYFVLYALAAALFVRFTLRFRAHRSALRVVPPR